MRQREIIAGKTYGDGKGNLRKVAATGLDYCGFANCGVRYEVTAKKSGPNLLGRFYVCTTAAFASWAKWETA